MLVIYKVLYTHSENKQQTLISSVQNGRLLRVLVFPCARLKLQCENRFWGLSPELSLHVEPCKKLHVKQNWHKIWYTANIFGKLPKPPPPCPNGCWVPRSRIAVAFQRSRPGNLYCAAPNFHCLWSTASWLAPGQISVFIYSLVLFVRLVWVTYRSSWRRVLFLRAN